jgi:CDP-diacylglycerol---glycerol-3-phosphate 3-phosphatidyltransferase
MPATEPPARRLQVATPRGRTDHGRPVVRMKLTIPTMLTLFRIALIPVLVVVFYLPYSWTSFAAAFIFALGAVTDWLDGWIARRYGMYSAFGAFLDPVADKLAVAVALILIVQQHATIFMALITAIIIGREITISALREWMAEIGQKARVRVVAVAKVKTIVQMVALVMLLYRQPLFGLPILAIGEVLLAIAAGLTLWSGIAYLRAAWPAMRGDVGNGSD